MGNVNGKNVRCKILLSTRGLIGFNFPSVLLPLTLLGHFWLSLNIPLTPLRKYLGSVILPVFYYALFTEDIPSI